jgi:hypothetical protein
MSRTPGARRKARAWTFLMRPRDEVCSGEWWLLLVPLAFFMSQAYNC